MEFEVRSGGVGMLLSTKGDYGVRAMIDLAKHAGEGPVQRSEIARRPNEHAYRGKNSKDTRRQTDRQVSAEGAARSAGSVDEDVDELRAY